MRTKKGIGQHMSRYGLLTYGEVPALKKEKNV
jgi:hypothetical protein